MATCVIACLLLCLPVSLVKAKDGGRYAVKASADSGDLIKIQRFEVEMTVLPSRRVEVEEKITVEFLSNGLTMFYHSLPTEGCIYSDIQASCPENPYFSYEVDDNPDLGGFIDINCIGGAQKGNVWTYTVTYAMQPNVFKGDTMAIDVVGYGSSVPIYDVTATVHFPETPTDEWVYVGKDIQPQHAYGLSEDGKTLTVRRSKLSLSYDNDYHEEMAEGITVGFTMPKGTLQGYGKTRVFTPNMWIIALSGGLTLALGAILFCIRKKREVVTVVNIKPPDGMSPLQMGKILDGNADDEDITSMLYYFAHKGYLKISLEDEEDPELTRLAPTLPEDAPAHERTLFDGLFDKKAENSGKVKISELVTRFYDKAETAKKQVLAPKPMYEKSSVFSFLSGGFLGGLYAVLITLFMGKKVGGGYCSPIGWILLLPVAINLVLACIRENYRYKWKGGKRLGFFLAQIGISVLAGVLFVLFAGRHFMSEWEKVVVAVGGLLPALLTGHNLTRTEKYLQTLGDILGFKDFILFTEEDKIKFMLEENPELYYEVLPYAQVLGVTDEWEKKFEKITLPPPTWYDGGMSTFDYIFLNRCIRNSVLNGLAKEAANRGGGHIGRSGGGGRFGSFGGGGFGGGGFGAR